MYKTFSPKPVDIFLYYLLYWNWKCPRLLENFAMDFFKVYLKRLVFLDCIGTVLLQRLIYFTLQ